MPNVSPRFPPQLKNPRKSLIYKGFSLIGVIPLGLPDENSAALRFVGIPVHDVNSINKKPLRIEVVFYFVIPLGLEPRTPTLKVLCSTD